MRLVSNDHFCGLIRRSTLMHMCWMVIDFRIIWLP
jgi:hypothetical protein